MAKANTLSWMRAMIRSGSIAKPPAWYPILCQHPPPPKQPITPSKAVPNIVFPTDRLIRIYEQNNPPAVPGEWQPYWEETADPISLKFAARQMELMDSGMSEEKAYKAAEKMLAKEESKSLKELENFTTRFQSMGDQPLFSDQKLAQEYQEWKAKFSEQPYYKWDYEEVIALDDWMMNSILKWGKTRQLYFKKERFMETFASFRKALFPEMETVPTELETYFEENEVRPLTVELLKPADQLPDYLEEYEMLLDRTESEETTPALLQEAEDWIAKYHRLVPEGTVSINDEELMGKLEGLCFNMFPALAPKDEVEEMREQFDDYEDEEPTVPLSRIYTMEEYRELSENDEDNFTRILTLRDANGQDIAVVADYIEDADSDDDLMEEDKEDEPITLPTFDLHIREQTLALEEAKWRLREFARRKRRRRLAALKKTDDGMGKLLEEPVETSK